MITVESDRQASGAVDRVRQEGEAERPTDSAQGTPRVCWHQPQQYTSRKCVSFPPINGW